jgi:WS/DGAT/MGAT family acyltransferase
VDWLRLDLAHVKRIKDRLGGTVNDVVLTVVAGAVRRFLARRGVAVDRLDYRVVVPVSVRGAADVPATNRLSAWLMRLPLDEPDPARRQAQIGAMTAGFKITKPELGPDVLRDMIELAGPLFFALSLRLSVRLAPYNLIVTNVPGPQMPLYLLGARLFEGYPVAPLFENQSLAVAILSYARQLCIGLNADWEHVPDLALFTEDLAASAAELRAAAEMDGTGSGHLSTRASG